jgi:KRAB domain-containing zinc finger protein
MHTNENPFTCTMCEKVFTKNSYLKFHIRYHHEKSFNYVCKECGKGFMHLPLLISHELKHTGERPFSCDLCTKSFFAIRSMKDHMKQKHGPKTYFTCDVCKKTFDRLGSLTSHKRAHFEENKKFDCVACNKTFVLKCQLKKHITIISHMNSKSYSCELCEKRFTTNHLLKKHLTVHSGVKSHVCGMFGRVYYHKRSLMRHLIIAHSETQTLFSCDLCENKYFSENLLIEHKLKKHPKETPLTL